MSMYIKIPESIWPCNANLYWLDFLLEFFLLCLISCTKECYQLISSCIAHILCVSLMFLRIFRVLCPLFSVHCQFNYFFLIIMRNELWDECEWIWDWITITWCKSLCRTGHLWIYTLALNIVLICWTCICMYICIWM